MSTWDERIDAVWTDAAGDEVGEQTIGRIDRLAAERGPDDARAEFERAGARDSAGRPEDAVPLYQRAMELGLDEEHRPQAVIQLASSLRNLGRFEEALALLAAEKERDDSGPYAEAVAVVHALVLSSAGLPSRALSVALIPHLPRYHRSMTAYARELEDGDT